MNFLKSILGITVMIVAFILMPLAGILWWKIFAGPPPGFTALVAMLLAGLLATWLAVALWRPLVRRFRGCGVAALLRRLPRFALLLVLPLGFLSMPSATQAIGTNLFRGNQTDLVNFTNAASGVGGLHLTNTIHQLTNGSTTITSQWVRLHGSGATLWAKFSPTNALLTNCVAEFQVSPDGTNASSSTILLNSMSSGAIAAGQWIASSNLPITLVGNIEFIRLYKVHFTNGANTVGSVFSTNTGPTFAVSQLKE